MCVPKLPRRRGRVDSSFTPHLQESRRKCCNGARPCFYSISGAHLSFPLLAQTAVRHRSSMYVPSVLVPAAIARCLTVDRCSCACQPHALHRISLKRMLRNSGMHRAKLCCAFFSSSSHSRSRLTAHGPTIISTHSSTFSFLLSQEESQLIAQLNAEQSIYGTSNCAENIRRLSCAFSCSPTNGLFVTATYVNNRKPRMITDKLPSAE